MKITKKILKLIWSLVGLIWTFLMFCLKIFVEQTREEREWKLTHPDTTQSLNTSFTSSMTKKDYEVSEITSPTNKLWARFEEDDNVIRLRGPANEYLGYYDKHQNITCTVTGRMIARGNILASLIKEI